MAKKTKCCPQCGETKELREFGKRARSPSGRHPWCKTCCRAYGVSNYDPNKRRAKRVQEKYNLTLEEYDELMQLPCAICGAASEALDHDHRSGRVRAPLCRGCNTGLGNFEDYPARLEAAAAYLRSHA